MIEILVAFTIAYEASNQSVECQQWVAKCIKVRSEERHITPKEVVMQNNGRVSQFSCWDCEGQPTQKRKLTDKEIGTAMLAWESCEEIIDRPNLYFDTSIKAPWWTKSPKVTFLKQIDDIRFYRERR